MSDVVQAKCPGCQRVLRIPDNLLSGAFQCKHCGQIIKARGVARTTAKTLTPATPRVTTPIPPTLNSVNATPPPPPKVKASDANGSDNTYLQRLRERRKKSRRVKLIVAAVLLAALGVVGLIFKNDIQGRIEGFVAEARHAATHGAAPVVAPTNTRINLETGPIEKPAATPPALKSTRPVGKEGLEPPTPPPAPAPALDQYPGRALLIGIRNYLYLNPLNPGYRPENSLHRDPLGLQHLNKMFTKALRFAPDQVVELSDVAEKPTSPSKGTLTGTLENFLQSSRPQDRVVLVFIGHALEVEGKGYLAPLEAEADKPDTLISVEWLYEQLEKCQAHRRVVLFDVAHLDPEQGLSRAGGTKLSEKLFDALSTMPEGVETWLSCSAGENSYEYNSSYIGSLFIHYLHTAVSELADPKKRKEIEAREGFKDEKLPLLFFAKDVHKELATEVKRRADAVQTPKLLGKAEPAPLGIDAASKPPAVAIKIDEGAEKLAEPKAVDEMLGDLGLADLTGQSLPPFLAKNLEDYKVEKDVEFVRSNPNDFPLRVATLEGAALLKELELSFTMGYKAEANDAQFKKKLEKEQQKPAMLDEKISIALEKLAKVDREKETSKRWQAHFDYVQSRLLAKRIWVGEYNFVVGNKLKKDTPTLKNAAVNNGWLIVPQEKLQQRDTRQWEKERQTLLDKLVKDHQGTPWEILARRDKSTNLGLTLQEAKVD